MNITFTSLITVEGKENKIEFTSPVTISNENGMDIFEFVEPSNDIMNRIEVTPMLVNIFAGPNTINLKLQEKVQVQYDTPQGPLFLDSEMHRIEISKSLIEFDYDLYAAGKIIGKYSITLNIQ